MKTVNIDREFDGFFPSSFEGEGVYEDYFFSGVLQNC
jgi:hypothetical protein